jgi:hypothetical protein
MHLQTRSVHMLTVSCCKTAIAYHVRLLIPAVISSLANVLKQALERMQEGSNDDNICKVWSHWNTYEPSWRLRILRRTTGALMQVCVDKHNLLHEYTMNDLHTRTFLGRLLQETMGIANIERHTAYALHAMNSNHSRQVRHNHTSVVSVCTQRLH